MDNTVPPAVVAFMGKVNDAVINPIIGVIFALALLYFLWGLFMFLAHMDNESKIAEGKRHMLSGIIGMTIMVSVFAIIALVLATFDIKGTDIPAPIQFI
jgi:protein-S-isoprenylcysteine O-methyltransferase Ste14